MHLHALPILEGKLRLVNGRTSRLLFLIERHAFERGLRRVMPDDRLHRRRALLERDWVILSRGRRSEGHESESSDEERSVGEFHGASFSFASRALNECWITFLQGFGPSA